MSRFDDASVLITGGARGMGKLVAHRCIEERAGRVVLWDIDEPTLAATADELRAAGGNIETAIVDLCDADRIGVAAEAMIDAGRPPAILFNNAGIVVGKRFGDHTTGDIERTVRVNVLAAMHTARAFLPGMIERGGGHIVNIASAAGLTPNPNMAVYAASKWAVLGWSESLRIELEESKSGVRVTTVCPSYVDTGMFAGARAPLLAPILQPQKVVDRIVRAVKTDRILIRTPPVVHLLPALRGLLPARWFDRLIGRGFRIYESMDQFTGRSGAQ